MKFSTATILLSAAALSNAAAIKRDLGSDLLSILNGNGNGNAALNGNGNGNKVEGNNVLSGLGILSDNSAEADGNDISVSKRDWASDLLALLNGNGNGNAALNQNGNGNKVDDNNVLSGIGVLSGNSAEADDNTVTVSKRDLGSDLLAALNGNGNGNSALNGNGNGNKVDGNNVLSGIDILSGNSASADGNSISVGGSGSDSGSDDGVYRRDNTSASPSVVVLPPTFLDELAKALNGSTAADTGSSNTAASGNGNGNSALDGNGNNNTVADNNILSGLEILSGNSVSADNNKIYILPIIVNQCNSSTSH